MLIDEKKIESKIKTLIAEYGTKYVLFAIKKINEQQLLYIEFNPELLSNFQPVMQVLEQVKVDLEGFYWHELNIKSESLLKKYVESSIKWLNILS